MNRLQAFFRRIQSRGVPEAEVRAEAWSLGCRHNGRVVEGAREELAAPGLSPHRALVLKAVIRERTRAEAARPGPTELP